VVVAGVAEVELLEDRANVAFDGSRAEDDPFANRGVGAPFGHKGETLALPVGQLVQRSGWSSAIDEGRDDPGVDDRAAVPDASDRLREGVKVPDAVLEEVAAPCALVLEQLHGVAGFDVLREDQDANGGVALPDPQGGLEAFVGECWGHPDVCQGGVGLQCTDPAQEVVGVVGLGEHIESLLPEQPNDAFPEQQRVVGDDQTHVSPGAGGEPRSGSPMLSWRCLMVLAWAGSRLLGSPLSAGRHPKRSG